MANEMLLIDPEPIKKFIVDGLNNPDVKEAFGHDAITILAEIEYAPTIEAEPVVHAEWISKDGRFCCSHCGYTRSLRLGYEMMVEIDGKWVSMERTKRCPDCGAHMDLKEADHG